MLKAALIITGIIVAIVIVLYIASVIAYMKMRYEDELLDQEGKRWQEGKTDLIRKRYSEQSRGF